MNDSNFSFKIISLNVRGLRNYRKRRKILNWFVKQGCYNGVCFIQEAHCDLKTEQIWRNQWRGQSFFSHGRTDSAGVISLIGNNLEFKLIQQIICEYGRYVILKSVIQGSKFVLINYYAPNNEQEQILFLKEINEIISNLNLDENEAVIWGGDFNCPLSVRDTDGGNYHPKLKSTMY